ncbi:MAG: hypothetical protein GC201_10595 [Alphaproteobacteria bacterium]|nr:hypothetical protein [Alphaproteobacteria bacterium]
MLRRFAASLRQEWLRSVVLMVALLVISLGLLAPGGSLAALTMTGVEQLLAVSVGSVALTRAIRCLLASL